jgi:hypothetical protein
MKLLLQSGAFACCMLAGLIIGTLIAQPVKERDSIQISVGPGKEVTVTVPNVSKANLAEILGMFFARKRPEDAGVEEKLKEVFGRSSELTVVITSKRER